MDAQMSRRVGDAERQAALQRLADGFAAGRLELTKYDARVCRAVTARTAEDLSALLADLPPDQPAPVDRRREDIRMWLREWQYWAGGTVLLTGVWAVRGVADGDPERFWPGVPLGIWAVVLLAIALWPSDDRNADD